jgi:hypothetical protein
VRKVQRAVEKSLSNLQLAIAEMAMLAFLSGVGTVIDQDQVRFRATVRACASWSRCCCVER